MKSQNQKGPNMKTTARYNLRFLLTLLLGGMLFAACGKDPVEKPQQHYNVTVKLNAAESYAGVSEALAEEPAITNLMNDNNNVLVDTIFIEPYGNWSWIRGANQTDIIKILKWARSKYSKTWGRGDFNFYPGDLSESDSLWVVQNGWTINQR